MDPHDVVYPYEGKLLGSKKECCIDTDHNMISLENRMLGEGRKSDTKGHVLCESIVRKCTEWANPQSGRLVLATGLGGRGMSANGVRGFSLG